MPAGAIIIMMAIGTMAIGMMVTTMTGIIDVMENTGSMGILSMASGMKAEEGTMEEVGMKAVEDMEAVAHTVEEEVMEAEEAVVINEIYLDPLCYPFFNFL
jgi:hypothetical protein